MPSFRYVAFTAEGIREEGLVEAANEEKAWENLSPLGLTIVSLSLDTTGAALRPSAWFGVRQAGIPINAQADLAEQLAILFAAHLPATEVVRIVAISAENQSIRRHFSRMLALLADGVAFPQAFERAGSGFSPVFKTLVQLGQTIADPAPIMRKLATSLRRREKLQAELTSALIYPVILLLGAMAVFLLVVLYLAPKLEPIFASVDKPIPSTIAFFLLVREIMLDHGVLLIGLALACVASLRILAIKLPAVFSQIVRKVPVWGPIKQDTSLARLSRSLQLMLAAGIPLSNSLSQTSAQSPDEHFSNVFAQAATSIETGGTASSAFAGGPGIPIAFRELISLGERTNALPGIMDTLASLLEDGVERKTQRISKLITPVLTLAIGALVGTMVYSVMAAILSVNDLAF